MILTDEWTQIPNVYEIPIDTDKLYLAYNAELKLLKRTPVSSEFLVKMFLSNEVTHFKQVVTFN